MRDRLKDWEGAFGTAVPRAEPGKRGGADAMEEAEAALLSLGYKPQEASRAVMQAMGQLEDDSAAPVTEQVIRLALKSLGKGPN